MNGIRGLLVLTLLGSSALVGLTRVIASASPAQPNLYSLRSSTIIPTSSAPSISEPSVPTTSTPIPEEAPSSLSLSDFSEEEIAYFKEIALGAEFGGESGIKRWKGPVRIQVKGSPDKQSFETLAQVIGELKELTGLDIQLTEGEGNITITFAPEAEFASLEPNYRPKNMGFFWTWWDGDYFTRAHILISTTDLTAGEQSHLIREELTQSMGLRQDSSKFPDSIFYVGWTSPTKENPIGLTYSELDKTIIKMLYQVPMEQLKTIK